MLNNVYVELRKVVNVKLNEIEEYVLEKDYSDPQTNIEQQERINELMKFMEVVKDIESEALEEKNYEVIFNCENLKSKVANLLEYIKIPYVF